MGSLLAPVVLVVAAAWSRRWIDDDGFINFRVVSELLHGHAAVFNPGERVEAFTSPLWIYLLAAGDVVLPIRLEWVAVLQGLAFTGVGFGFSYLVRPGCKRGGSTTSCAWLVDAIDLVARTSVWACLEFFRCVTASAVYCA